MGSVIIPVANFTSIEFSNVFVVKLLDTMWNTLVSICVTFIIIFFI